MNNLAFSIDLDDWYHTPLVSGADFSHYKTTDEFFKHWKEKYDYVSEPTYRLLDLLEKYNLKVTFFVIADMVDRYPELMSVLKSSGHEIAHHSLHHTIPFNTKTKEKVQTEKEWEDELLKAKGILEKYFEREIVGYRAPGAYFADWMVPILIKNGFRYDSSLVSNSIYNKSNRHLKHFPKVPFYLNTNFEVAKYQEEALLEIPWVSRKVGSLYLPGGGAFFFRLFGAKYFIRMFNQHLKAGDGVFYIHSLDLSNEKFPLSNFRNRPFYWVNKGDKTLRQLDLFLGKFHKNICSCNSFLTEVK
jgi:peptidoglycan-N-acetylglucosamine deacetylase